MNTPIIIGVTTYGSIPIERGFVSSLLSNIPLDEDLRFVMVDDGTPDKEKVQERAALCKINGFQFIAHPNNQGIAAAWNSILHYAAEQQADVCCIFNNDIRFLNEAWVSRIAYFLRNNEKIGMVGLPLVNEPGFNDNDTRWMDKPGRVGAAVGAAFAVNPELALTVENPDGSMGFWTDTLAFHEEVHFGFRLAEKGHDSYMIGWPPCHHIGGATFATSSELSWRKPSDYISMDEFLNYTRNIPWYYPEFEEQYKKGVVDRMSYSRAMFCKYWGIFEQERHQVLEGWGDDPIDLWAEPQKFVHMKIVTPMPKKLIKWIDKNGQIQQAEI